MGLNHKELPGQSIPSVQLDIHEMDISNDGVKDFFWPISYQEYSEIGHEALKAYTALVKSIAKEDHDPVAVPYKLIGKHFILEAIGFVQGDMLRERFAKEGREADVPDSWRLWPFLLKKESPPYPSALELLREGPEKPNHTKKLLNLSRFKKLLGLFRLKKGGLSFDGLKIKPVTSEALEKAIIVTQRTGTISDHAGLVMDKEKIFCRSHKWFSPVNDLEFRQSLEQNDQAVEKSILNAIEDVYTKNDVPFGNHARKYLEEYLSQGTALLRVHYQRLLQKPEKLPRHIWTGTGGNIWDMMLRLAVIVNGGIAEGHDHAIGQGVHSLCVAPFSEFWGASSFVTYNQAQIDGLMENTGNEWASLDSRMPEIKKLGQIRSLEDIKVFPRFTKRNPTIKTIALMATVYDCDRGRLAPVPANIVAVDWQARMISHLKSWGYDVVIKIHPESPLLPPFGFETDLGAKIVAGRFEDMFETIDMVLFDYIYTTTFRSALETNMPIVISDYYGISWSSQAKNLVEKRCSIIKGYYDEQNRAQIDWNAFQEGLKGAPSKANNHEFTERFLL